MAAGYTITTITRTVDLTPGGIDGYVYEVAFKTTPHGATGAVLIPVTAYTAKDAAPVIAAAAEQLERTYDL